ncbi:MAG: Gfo/Idh/MocA family protein [Kiritimatiellia bacterium]|jgi:predicted dehydrogenase
MIKIALIGIDTSHTVSYPEVIQGPKRALTGMRAISCLSFMTPFTNQKVIDERTAKLTELGVKVTKNLDEALEGCDAIMLEINDGSYHLEYFRKVAALGKPVFLDKPLACSLADGRAILRLAAKHKTRVWSGSSIPFSPDVKHAKELVPDPRLSHIFGPLGIAPSGDSLIWYGVHVVETMQRLMGPGAKSARAIENDNGITVVVDYGNERQGLLEIVKKCGSYGGRVQGVCKGENRIHQFICKPDKVEIMRQIKKFFNGGPAPVSMQTTFEGLAVMIAARKSIETGRAERLAAAPC